MALGETARLVASLELQDKFSGPATAASKSLNTLERATTRTGGGFALIQRGFGIAGRAASGVEGAFAHLGGRISGLLSGPLGVLGLGAGLLGLGTIIGTSLTKTSDFALSLEKLTALTGESAQSMGELILVSERFGVDSLQLSQIVGFTEKTLGKLSETAGKTGVSQSKVAAAHEAVVKATERLNVAQLALNAVESKSHVSAATLAAARYRVRDATVALTDAENGLKAAQSPTTAGASKLIQLQKQFGVQLTDSQGKALSFSQVLNNVADFYNTNAAASTKADLAAKVFGRGYAAIIPILQLGSKGIKDAEQAVGQLGLSLGTDTQGALQAYKTSLRQIGEAVNTLEIGIGLALAPAITKAANSFTLFLEQGGAKQIIGVFKDLSQFALNAADVVNRDVFPAIKGIYGAWQTIPSDLRDLIIKGFVADRTIKFLFGFSLLGIGKDLLSGIGGLLGKVASSKLIPQVITAAAPIPVFVTNPGFGLPGGGGGLPVVPAAEAAGGLGALGLFGSAVLVAGLGAAAAAIAIPVVRQLTFNGTDPTIPGGSRGFFPGKGPADLQKYLDANSTAVKDNTDAILKGTTKGQLPGAPGGGHPAAAKPPERRLSDAQLILALSKTSEFGFAGIGTKIEHGPLTGTDPFGQQALALFRQAEFPRQGKTLGEIERHIIAAEDAQKQYLAKGDTKSARLIQVTIDGLRALLRGTDKVATITQAEAQKRADTANRLNRLLDPLPGGIRALVAKDFNPIVNVRVTTNTQVSVSNVVRAVNNYTAAIGSGPGGALDASLL